MTVVPSARTLPLGPWTLLVLLAAGVVTAVAFAPVHTLFVVPAVAASGYLVRRHGLQRGLLYLFVAMIPLRQPLGIDVFGTVTLYLGDVLLPLLVAPVLWDHGFRDLLRRSPFLKVGLVLLVLSAAGLYTAPNLVQGIATLHRIVFQIAVFFLVRQSVRDGRDARNILFAFLAGLTPAIIYGIYQATVPVEPSTFPTWSTYPLAWDPETNKAHIRIFSTFDHSLRFSHALSAGFGVALGLLPLVRTAGLRFFLVALMAGAVFCNTRTYSVSGIVGTGGAVAAWLIIHRRRRVIWSVPVLVLIFASLTPAALSRRAEMILTGESTSAMARLISWRQSVMIIRDHPILGVGWAGLERAFEHEYRISLAKNVAFSAENMFLQRGVALGLPGLLIALFLCLQFFRNARSRPTANSPPWPREALLLAGAAFFTQALFIPVGDESNNFFLWMLFALAESMRESSAS